MTAAIMVLKKRNILALPVHDSLVVPQTAVEMTKAALIAAYQDQLDVTPRLKVLGAAPTSVSPPKEFTPEDPEWWQPPVAPF
jgi:hypothetical protein